jgi:undecaprenyl phosphate N,N'-diacetylbacillosamine 1-phosphate transferase
MASRIRDLALCLLATPLVLPVCLLCALAVKLSSRGPVLYRQPRMGLGGAPFQLVKFRSMRVGAADLRNPDGSAFAGEEDPRVTRAGRLLRATSLDELPQLWNVLRGEMSLVGPRPDQPDQLSFYSEAEKRKLLVKPGLTGLAQISGRNGIPWNVRKALDIEYVARRSFWLDLAILWRTVPSVLLRRGIHTPGGTLRPLEALKSAAKPPIHSR